MSDFLFYALSGAGVGLAIGMTGVGGGSLMTPLLIFSGVPAPTAIGTDLLYATITKAGGIHSYWRAKSIRWRLALTLAAGSLPAALITAFAMKLFIIDSESYHRLLRVSLGTMLLSTAVFLITREFLARTIKVSSNYGYRWVVDHASPVTVLVGCLLGILVTLSSVGAGVVGTAMLMMLYPKLSPIEVIGTELAHAVPLTLVAGLGHWVFLNNIDWLLLWALLVGSLPAVFIGARIGHSLPPTLLRFMLTLILMVLGVNLLR